MPSGYLQPTVKIDATRLNQGVTLALQFCKKAPADACNFTAKEVAFGAYANTPVTTAGRVDTELGKIVTPKIGKRGGIVKGSRYAGAKKVEYTRNGKTTEVPLAVLIVQARTNWGSKYNITTGGRYSLPHSPFYGLSRAAGRAAMQLMVDQMIKGRRRAANGFIRAGWLKSMATLKELTPAKYRGHSYRLPTGQNIEALGSVQPAKTGNTTVACQIENDVGLDNLNPNQNRALLSIGARALQTSMDEQGRSNMEYALAKSAKEDLEGPVNRVWK